MALHLECLSDPAHQLASRLFPALAPLGFVLAGGTGLALQLGHRVSVDFDLFVEPDRFPRLLKEQVAANAATAQVLQDRKETLDVLLDNVKCSFFSYPYPFSAFQERLHSLPIACVLDIAAMKLIAIAQRGARKDFIDLYVVLQAHGFDAVFANALRRFGPRTLNPLQIGKSLAYFADAERDPDPTFVGAPVRWSEVREYFRTRTREFVQHMISATR